MSDYKIKDVVDINGNSIMPKTIASAVMIDNDTVEQRIKSMEKVIDNLDLSSLPTKADRVHTHNYNDIIVSENNDGSITNVVDYVEDRLTAKAEKVHSHSNYITSIPNTYVQREELSAYSLKNHTHTKSQIVDLVIPDFSTKADAVHTHAISDITGLQDALNSKPNLDTVVTTTTFNSMVNEIQIELNKKSNIGHTHEIEDINKLQSNLDGKSNKGHTHNYTELIGTPNIPDITGKADTIHYHKITDVEGLQTILNTHTHSFNDLTDKPEIPNKNDLALVNHTHIKSDVEGLEQALSDINTAISTLSKNISITGIKYSDAQMAFTNDEKFNVTLIDKTGTYDNKEITLLQSSKVSMNDLGEELKTTINNKVDASQVSDIISNIDLKNHELRIQQIIVNPEIQDENGNITQEKETLEDVLAHKSNVGHTHDIAYIENLHPVLRLLSLKVEDALKRIRTIEVQLNIPSVECTDQVMSDVYPEMYESDTPQALSNLDDYLE